MTNLAPIKRSPNDRHLPVSMLAAFIAARDRRPDTPAILYFGTPISFAELDRLSDGLAVSLQEGGVRPGDRVAAYLQNVPQFPLVMLAAWKIGAILVATNPMLRHKELRALLNDSGASVLVTLESLWLDVARDVVSDTGVRRTITTSELDFLGDVVPEVLRTSMRARDENVDDLLELAQRYAGRRPAASAPSRSDVAFLTYTSGTTGPAKGAMNTHGNVIVGAETYRDTVGLGDEDVILGIAPLFHITGLVAHIALGMVAGIPVVLHYRFDVQTVFELVERHGATFTVAAITAYVALMNAEGTSPRMLRSLRWTLSGGAPIAPALAKAWQEHTGTPLVPVYGLTETTGPTNMVPPGVEPPVDENSGALSVGRPVPGTSVWAVDDAGREVPAGTAGEIVVCGPQVVPGYWEQPEESAAVFMGGAMRTGDVGVIDADGWCFIVDRKKDLINASGYKVWPREVEDGLLSHPAVREAAVIGVADSYRGESVKAFVSLKAGMGATERELIDFCRARMAAYKYPRAIVVLDELPKNASGKLMRRELRDVVLPSTR